MTKIHVVQRDNANQYTLELDQYFRKRHEVFVQEKGWKDLERSDQREVDEFDTEDATHLLAIDDHQVIGGLRLNPSTGPTLLSEVFSYLCSEPLVGAPDVVEMTRLWVVKGRRKQAAHRNIESLLMAGSLEYALALGIKKIRGVAESWRLDRNQRLGWTARALGPPRDVGGHSCIALEKYVSEEIWVEICPKLSVFGSVLVWKGIKRPQYRLPSLIPAVA
jgi:acyl-homoserine lactone synthase